jgi:hypothetical protein
MHEQVFIGLGKQAADYTALSVLISALVGACDNGGAGKSNPQFAAGIQIVAGYARNVLQHVSAASDQTAKANLTLHVLLFDRPAKELPGSRSKFTRWARPATLSPDK